MIITILSLYSLLTVVPFYFLVVRSFVPTALSATLQLWIPRATNPSGEAVIGDLATFYHVDIRRFQGRFGIHGYLDPQLTISEISRQYGVPLVAMEAYFRPLYLLNGWYAVLFGGAFFRALLITAYVVAASVALGALLGLATGSVLARFRKRWHRAVYNLYMLQIVIPIVMIMLPLYFVVSRVLHLDNTFLAVILLNAQGGALPTMLFTAHVASIPEEIRDSVEVDGGGRVTYFFRMVLPLSTNVIAAYVAIRVPAYWNDLVGGFLFLERAKYPLIPYLNSLTSTFTTNFQIIYAGLAFSVVPLLILYLFFSRLFVRSMIAGAIKG